MIALKSGQILCTTRYLILGLFVGLISKNLIIKATAGKDQLLKIWVLQSFHSHFIELIRKYNYTDGTLTFIRINK